jgi:hypothetical protein
VGLVAGPRLAHEVSNVLDGEVHVVKSPIAVVVFMQVLNSDLKPQCLSLHLLAQGVERALIEYSVGCKQLIYQIKSLAYDNFIYESSMH